MNEERSHTQHLTPISSPHLAQLSKPKYTSPANPQDRCRFILDRRRNKSRHQPGRGGLKPFTQRKKESQKPVTKKEPFTRNYKPLTSLAVHRMPVTFQLKPFIQQGPLSRKQQGPLSRKKPFT
uniref:Uncharacterized protein n=1 Tax=Picea sitchensis TaxID=3332 RepID=A0A6B9XSM0_PICSI|nr:hypothetical protein Q903MT_gene4005 [Picea sitchensis]